MGLILGAPAPGRGPRPSDTPPSAGSTARSGATGPSGHRWWHTRARKLRVRAHRARNDPPGGVASRTSLLPPCAGTPRIRRDEGHKPTGRGGLGQGGRQPIRPGNRGVLPLATMIASVNCPRRLAEHVTKHPPARNHPTCDCCHDLLHRAAPVAVAIPTGRLVVRALTRHPGRALVPNSGRWLFGYLCAA